VAETQPVRCEAWRLTRIFCPSPNRLQTHQWSTDHSVRATTSVEAQSIAMTNRNFTASIESMTKDSQAMLLSVANMQIEKKLSET